jgi:hypothetical protein
MKKFIVAGALAIVSMGAGGTAFAGEIDGTGELTPINRFQAGSICSFSGLNDDPTGGGDPFQDGKVQNWGTVVEDAKVFIGDGDHGANELASMILPEGPGTHCRGFASQD